MITSTSNAQIKELAKLQKKSRLRDEKGIFLVEGPRMTEEIPAERIEKVYASESFAKKNKEFLEITGAGRASDRYCVRLCVRYKDTAGNSGDCEETQLYDE